MTGMLKRIDKFLPLVGLVVLMAVLFNDVGCIRQSPLVVRPGAISQFDATAYDTLRVAKAALVDASALAKENPELIPPVNKAIAAYNLAESGWQAYHTAGRAAADTGDLNRHIGAVVEAVAAVFRAVEEVK